MRRFDEIRASVDASDKILANRPRQLVEGGLATRTPYGNASPGKYKEMPMGLFISADAVRPLNHLDGIGELRSQQANRGTVLPVRQGENEVALRMPLNRGDI